MSNNPQKVEALTKGGIEVIELIACEAPPALMHCRTCGPRRKGWGIRSRSCKRSEELAFIGAPMSNQRPGAVDLLFRRTFACVQQ